MGLRRNVWLFYVRKGFLSGMGAWIRRVLRECECVNGEFVRVLFPATLAGGLVWIAAVIQLVTVWLD